MFGQGYTIRHNNGGGARKIFLERASLAASICNAYSISRLPDVPDVRFACAIQSAAAPVTP